MLREIGKFVVIIAFFATLALPVDAQSQSCYAGLSIDYLNYVDRDGTQYVSLPVYIGFDCPIGGFLIDIKTEPYGALEPVDVNTEGGLVDYWEVIEPSRLRQKEKLRILGIANYPDGEYTPPLEPQTGLLFNVLFRFGCDYDENVQVTVLLDSVFISDSTGYELFDDVNVSHSWVYVGEEITDIDRGDMNCDGMIIGADVSFLVNYFRGVVLDCPCSLCAGDINNDGRIIGSDVTYLVNYFIGRNPPPDPCD